MSGKVVGQIDPLNYAVLIDGDPFPSKISIYRVGEGMAVSKKVAKAAAEAEETEDKVYTKKDLNKMKAAALGEVAESLDVEDWEELEKPDLVQAILAKQEEEDEEPEEDEDLEDDDEEDEDEEDLFEDDDDEEDEDEDEDEEEDDEEDGEEDSDEDDDEEDEDDEEELEEEEEELKPKRTKGKTVSKPAPVKADVKPGQNPFRTSTQKGAIADFVIRTKFGTRKELVAGLKKQGVKTKSGLDQGISSRLTRCLRDLEAHGFTIHRDGPDNSQNQVIAVWYGTKKPKGIPEFKASKEDRAKTKERSDRLAKARAAREEKTTKAAPAAKSTKTKTTKVVEKPAAKTKKKARG